MLVASTIPPHRGEGQKKLQLKSLADSRVGKGSQRSMQQGGMRRGRARAVVPTHPLASKVPSASSGHLDHQVFMHIAWLGGSFIFSQRLNLVHATVFPSGFGPSRELSLSQFAVCPPNRSESITRPPTKAGLVKRRAAKETPNSDAQGRY